MVPTFTSCSIGQAGTQLYPGSIATPTPQTFSVASAPASKPGHGVGPSTRQEPRTAPRPISTRLEPVDLLRGVNHWFAHAVPSDLASRTRTIWQYWHVPALSELLSALPGVPRVRLLPASPDRCDNRAARASHPHSNIKRLVAHVRSTRSALPILLSVGFSEPPPEPGVPITEHRALHDSR